MTPATLLLTYVVHSTVLLGLAWALDRFVLNDLALKEVVWKSAILAGLASTALAAGLGFVDESSHRKAQKQIQVEKVLTEGLGASAATHVRVAWRLERPCEPGATSVQGFPLKPPGRLIRALDACAKAAGPGSGFLGLFWVLGVGLFGLRWFVGLSRVLRLASQARPLARRGHVSVRVSPELQAPSAVGSCVILIPERALGGLTPQELEAALAHEEAHLERGDPFWCWGLALLSAVAFFQPLHRVAARRVSELSEVLSDDVARSKGVAPLDLARAIERVCAWRLPGPLLAPALGRPQGPTVMRIERLTSEFTGDRVAMPNLRLALVCLLFLVAGGLPRMSMHTEGPAEVVVIVEELDGALHLSEGAP